MEEFIQDIPTWDNGTWTTSNYTRNEFKEFVTNLFKEPGQYTFDKDTLAIGKQEAIKFEKLGYYCDKPFKSKDFTDYWNLEKNKCRKGLIIKNNNGTWFLTRDYYMWLNFLPIFDKEKTKFGFAKLRDAQYHMALYELLAELNWKHAAILKKRQIASEQPHSEPVLGEHGWTTMGTIQPGDKLWNPDGTLTTILHKSNNGISDVYEFKFGDGRTTRCGIEHNWEVYDDNTRKICILNTKKLLEEGLKNSIGKYRFSIDSLTKEEFIKRKESARNRKFEQRTFRNSLISITKLDYQEESSCIVVDNPNHLYITRDYIVTHNSYFHAGKLINQLWFEEGVTLKMGASLKDYINEKGTWKFLDEYANFLNEYTAWYRPMNPKKVLMWQQKIEEKVNGRTKDRGLKGTIQGMSFEKDPTNSVGGPVKYFFHEEAGIAPKMDQTYEYIRPALKSGFVTTGLFIAAGSVGDLDQCEPLKDMVVNPVSNDIFPVESNLIDDKGTIGLSGLFIPEQWSMPPYIDDYGNSKVEDALEALSEQFTQWKKELTPEQYQLRISQHPRNIKEAFATRTVSKFPQHLLSHQAERIRNKDYPYEFLDIYSGVDGKPEVKITNKLPISEFPLSKKASDKTGVLVVWERPVENPEFGMYYGSIDPVSEGRTTSSDSLCSIYIYKRKIQVKKINGTEVTTYLERDKVVAAWCGRFDDINKTHERLRLIIEWYNAKTLVENNISLFINYMIGLNKQKYLVRKDEMVFLKELGSNMAVYQEYGWKNTGRLFKDHLLSYVIEYLKESIDEETKPDGTVVKTTYGVERIPDPMLIVEMQAYEEGLNVDRLVSFSALVAYIKILESNTGIKERVEKDDAAKNLEKSSNMLKLNRSPFRHMGAGKNGGVKKSAFKNLK
jgi:hypothetical protein